MSQRAARLACIALTVALVALLAGCGGGSSSTPAPAPTPTGTAAISGVVVDASNTSSTLPSAVVHVAVNNASTTTGSSGSFGFSDLPAGTTTLTVDPGPGESFFSSTVSVPLASGQTTSVVVTMVPLGLGVPTRITIAPSGASVDPGGQQQFTALIYAGSTQLNIEPSWIVQGGIGTIDSSGLFTGSAQGAGSVIASVGDVTSTASVSVTGPQPPKIWSSFIDPMTLPPAGGLATMTLHASDGDGIKSATVEIVPVGGNPMYFAMYRTAGTDKDGTWVFPVIGQTATYLFPLNTNVPDSTGTQAPMDYDVRFTVTDNTNAQTVTDFYQVEVSGVVAPPSPP